MSESQRYKPFSKAPKTGTVNDAIIITQDILGFT